MFFVIIICCLILSFYCLRKYNNVWKYSEKLCGHKALPFIGNAHQIGSTPVDYLKYAYETCKEFNYRPFRVWLGPVLYVFISAPEDIQVILSSNKYIDKLDDYKLLHPWLGNGLVTSTGSVWHNHRKIITPTFHFKILHDFHEVINDGASRLCEVFKKLSETNNYNNIQDLINLATLDIICETAMGVQLNILDNPESNIAKAFHDASSCYYQRVFSAWKRFDLLFKLSKEYKINENAMKTLSELNNTVIQKRKRLLAEGLNDKKIIEEDYTDNIKSRKIRRAFLDTLLLNSIDAGGELTDKEISDEVSTFVFAGHDTTASAISFAIYHLSIYPNEQEKLYDEQKCIFNADENIANCDAKYDDISEMKYLDLFIKESQRLITAVPFIGRMMFEKLNLNGRIIPAGTHIGLFLYAMGHNPKVFPNPMEFNPKRFEKYERENKNPYEYVPFSAGPRNCIGQRFAVLELKTVLSKLIRNFKFITDSIKYQPIIESTTTTISSNGIFVKIEVRK